MGGGQCRCCGSFLDPQLEHAETCSKEENTRGHYACVHAVVCGMKLADPGITTEPRGLTASQYRPADISTTAAVPGRSAALHVCVASSIAAAARGDAAQATFDRKLSQYRNEMGELRQQRTHYPPSCVDGGRTAVTRTLQYVADIASSRNGPHFRRNPFIAGGNTISKIAFFCASEGSHGLAQFSRILQREQSGSSQVSSTETDAAIPDDDDALSPWRATRTNLCSHQVSTCPGLPPCEWGVVGRRWLSHAVNYMLVTHRPADWVCLS